MPVFQRKRETQKEAAIAAVETITSSLLGADTVREVRPVLHRGGVIQFEIVVDPELLARWTAKLSNTFSQRGKTSAIRQDRIDRAIEVLALPPDIGLNGAEHDVHLMYI